MTAIHAIDEFHTRYNAEQAELIYRDAYESFRLAASEPDMAAAMMNTHNRYGDMISVTNSLVNAVLPPPVNVNAVYNTKFAKGDATEYFVWIIDGDGSAKLASYRVSPGSVDLSKVKQIERFGSETKE